jgi:hypothetical protein
LFGNLDHAPTVRHDGPAATLAQLQQGRRAGRGLNKTTTKPLTRLLDHGEHVGRQAKLLEYADFGTGARARPPACSLARSLARD